MGAPLSALDAAPRPYALRGGGASARVQRGSWGRGVPIAIVVRLGRPPPPERSPPLGRTAQLLGAPRQVMPQEHRGARRATRDCSPRFASRRSEKVKEAPRPRPFLRFFRSSRPLRAPARSARRATAPRRSRVRGVRGAYLIITDASTSTRAHFVPVLHGAGLSVLLFPRTVTVTMCWPGGRASRAHATRAGRTVGE